MSKGFKIKTLSICALLAATPSAFGLEVDGSGVKSGVQALYIFNETSGVVVDSSGVATPLNLTIDNAGSVTRSPGVLQFRTPAVAKSGAAAGLAQACKATNEITIEAWLSNQLEEPARPKPVRILSMGRKKADGTGHEENFYLGQDYDAAAQFSVGINLDGAMRVVETPAVKGKVFFSGMNKGPQHVVFTRDALGVTKIYLSDDSGVLLPQTNLITRGTFAQWADDMVLSVGNLPNYADFPEYKPGTQEFNPERKSWTGNLNVLAVYCRALSAAELIGASAPGTSELPIIPIGDPYKTITASRKRAQLIYRRLTGVNTPIDNPLLIQMEDLIDQGKSVEAARIATLEESFLNITIRDMAARMSTRDQTVNTPLNDMVATIIGIARDDRNAQEMLTGNYSYRGDVTLAAVPKDEVKDFLTSNSHYEALEAGRFDLAKVLVRVDGQKLYNGSTRSVVANPDPAGVLTSRAFLAAHVMAGTNRRAVVNAVQQFMCLPIGQWADATATDTYVGQDVDRAPGSVHNTYKTSCRTCHSVMDGFRGAFAKLDFSANYVKHGDVMYGLVPPTGADADKPEYFGQDPLGISNKMTRNADTFPGGNRISSTFWVNSANQTLNAAYFGWPAPPAGESTNKGNGLKDFATLISQAKAFPKCMATRAYRAACKRDPVAAEDPLLNEMAEVFKQSNYNFRTLFSSIVVRKECIGQ